MSFGGNAQRRLRAHTGPLKREPIAAEREPGHHELIAMLTSLWWRAVLLDDASAAASLRAPSSLPGLREADRWQLD